MDERCIEVEELARVVEEAPNSPRRAHLETCPRCRARHAAYLRFMAGAGEVPADEAARATRRLDAELRVRIEGETPPAERRSGARGTRPDRPRRGWLQPILAAAVLVVIASLVPLVRHWRAVGPDSMLLRGEEPAERRFRTEVAIPLADGGLRLSWTPVSEAMTYQVSILDGALAEVATFEAGGDTSFVLTNDELQRLRVDGRPLAWRVRARNGGDEIAHSSPRPLPGVNRPAPPAGR